MSIGIKGKLLGLLIIMSVFMVTIGIIGLAGFNQSNRSLQDVFEDNLQESVALSKIDGLMRANRIQMLLALQHDPKNEYSSLHDHPTSAHTDLIKKTMQEIDTVWASFYHGMTDSEARALADKFQKERGIFEKSGLLVAARATLDGNFPEAYRITFETINPTIKRANQAMEELMAHELQSAKETHEKATARYTMFRNIIIAAIVIALACGFAIGIPITRSIGRSSILLKNAASSLADGDLTVRAEVMSRDEMGQISKSFNEIADAYAGLVQQIATCAERVSLTSAELKDLASQMAKDNQEVVQRSESVATAGEEMAATSNDIAGSCSRAVETADFANKTAVNGVGIVDQNVQGMNRIADKVQETARTVQSLGTRSDQIGQIVGTIHDIADQTNLLALNAAIEAARAGEQGRGFAVVADEVRALAERTSRATREIGEMIKIIQTETSQAVHAMKEGVAEVGKGTEDAARSGHALQEILQRVNEVTSQINQIANAADQQTSTTNEISSNMIQITEMAKTASDCAKATNGSVEVLQELSNGLKSIVGKYRFS